VRDLPIARQRVAVASFGAPALALPWRIDYGRLPVEVAAFFDASVAWSRKPTSFWRRAPGRA
jgi:hypothetical protein